MPEAKTQPALEQFSRMEEVQLTFGEQGHFLHTTQCFSSNDQWIVYDSRNNGEDIGRTCCIEMIHTRSAEVRQLYHTGSDSQLGPGVGAATFNPKRDVVLFIHGLTNYDSLHPYGFTRRSGMAVDLEKRGTLMAMDARDIRPPFTAGALRGGTHAHTWSADGKWVSFTYNDAVLEARQKSGNGEARDLRMVGVMAPDGPIDVEGADGPENFGGEMFTVVVTRVTEHPVPGSDQIDRAYEDGWVGENGYARSDGSRQKRAVAFQGDVRNAGGVKLTEIFICDLPDDITKAAAGESLAGTPKLRPYPPAGTVQRRLTRTGDRNYPGVQGPRHWLRSTPDGSLILFLMKNDAGITQVFGISPNGGSLQQITCNSFSVETTFSVHPGGAFVAYGNQEDIYITNINSGKTLRVCENTNKDSSGLKSICWSNDGTMLCYNRKTGVGANAWYQVYLLQSE